MLEIWSKLVLSTESHCCKTRKRAVSSVLQVDGYSRFNSGYPKMNHDRWKSFSVPSTAEWVMQNCFECIYLDNSALARKNGPSRKTRIKGKEEFLNPPGLQGSPGEILPHEKSAFVVKLGKTSLPFFYMCRTVIFGLWTSSMQPLGSVVRKKPTPKQTQTLHPQRWKRSTQTNTSFPSEIVCLSSPWTSRDDATLSPHRIWWVPSGAGWSLRRFGQKMPLVVSPQPVFFVRIE